MDIVFMGTPDFAVKALEKLYESCLLYTSDAADD